MDTKALRQKILDLAIRGKLVPQDPNDEPASVLLERIREQKQQMVKEGKLKKKDIKNDSVIFVGEDNLHYEKFQDGTVKCIEDEISFELPEGWAWCRLKSIATIQSSKRVFEKDYVDNGIPFYRSKEIGDLSRNEEIRSQLFVTEAHYLELKEKYGAPQMGDILITSVGSIGNTWICDGRKFYYKDGNITQIVANSFFVSEYVQSFLKTDYFFEQIGKTVSGSAYNALTIEKLKNILLALPPYNEQQQIVNFLKPYNKLIETIEVSKTDLLQLLSKVKSKILDLAIRGQLVLQDPNDEPASVLLERIRAEKEDLIKQGKIKRNKKESIIFKGEDNSYYLKTGELVESLEDWAFEELPDSWSVCCLGELCDYGNSTNVNTADIADSAWILDLEDIEKDSGVILQKVRQDERNAGSTKHRFHKGQVLYSKLRPYLNKVVLADEDGYCTSEILPLEFERNILPQYARYFLMSQTFLRYANKCSYGVKMPRLGTADGKKAIISVPPVKEQKRIVMAIELAFAQLASITKNLT